MHRTTLRPKAGRVRSLCLLLSAALAAAFLAAVPQASLGAVSYSWTRFASNTTMTFNGVSALDATHAWAVDDDGAIHFFDGSSWRIQASGTGESLRAVSALSANSVWAVGEGGRMLHFNGSFWQPKPSGTTKDLFGVSALDSTHAWAVGGGDTVCRWNGSGWSATELTPPMGARGTLLSVCALDANHVWAVGDGALHGRGADIYFWNGSAWSYQQSGTAGALLGVSALDANHVWAVGENDVIDFFDGSKWTPSNWTPPIGTAGTLRSVSAVRADAVFAVGEGALHGRGGDILFYDGSGWSLQDSQTAQTLTGVSAPDTEHAWAVGTNGLIEYGRPSPAPTSRAWGTDSIGIPTPRTDWYLAEGSTGPGFETWIVVQNPNPGDADVELTYMTPAGEAPGPSVKVPASSRMTFNVAGTVGNTYEVSTKVHSSQGVVAERAMYGNGWAWGTDSIGAPAPKEDWYLAEGSTGQGFETWVVVQNPNATPADVTLTYMTPGGVVPGPGATLPPNSRESFEVARTVQDYQVSTKVHSSQGVVAERAMYGNNKAWGHDSIGASAPKKAWYLAEGSTGPGFETWVVVQNPGGSPAHVTLTYMTPGGVVPGPGATLEPGTRKTFEVAKTVKDYEVSTKVDSDMPVVAERAMYGNGRAWGHDSIGVSTPSASWYLAEGCTAPGFETWVLVQNPNAGAVEVTLTYMTPSGVKAGPAWSLMGGTRKSFNIADVLPGEPEVSTRITATGGEVVAERSVYGNAK